jgi:carbohydrate-selective porin OprB
MKTSSKSRLRPAGCLGALGLLASVIAGAPSPSLAGTSTSASTSDITVSEESALSAWWNGKYATGNWFGVRDLLEDRGINFSAKYTGDYYGVVDSQRGSRGFWDQELAFAATVKFDKLLDVEALEGLSAFGGVRYRDSRADSNPNNFAQASGNFQPSHFQSGTQWRLITFGLEYATPEAFGVKQFLTLRGGWIQPQKEFIDQPLSKLFVNNTFESSKGIGGNIPFSSSYSTWGGTLKLKPTEWFYMKGGAFLAFPSATSSSNHGLAMEGYAQDPSRNGTLWMAETGVTPSFGEAKLDGKYAIGGYYFGVGNNSFFGERYAGQYGFYGQADQQLFREPSPEVEVMAKGPSDSKSVVDDKSGKSFKEPVSMEKPKLSKQGLYMFNLVTFAPKYNNILPFYFHTGFSYVGLIPGRDEDQTLLAFGYGSYSFSNIENLQENVGNVNQPNYTAVLEAGYRIQLNKWLYTQPFVQYIIKPNGTGNVQNATILGVQSSVIF